MHYVEVVGSEFICSNGSAFCVEELYWSGISVLGEERNCLFSSLNLVQNLVDVGSLANEVGCADFHYLLLVCIFIVVDDGFESLHVDGVDVHTLEFFVKSLHFFFLLNRLAHLVVFFAFFVGL